MPSNKEVKQTKYLLEEERLIKIRFHRWVINTHGGLWKIAAQEVYTETGMLFKGDSLRQNIKAESKKKNKGARPIKDLKKLEALKSFLLKKNYLTEKELQASKSNNYFPVVFSEFIDSHHEIPNHSCLQQFNGLFFSERTNDEDIENLHFDIDYFSDEALVKILETSFLEEIQTNQITDVLHHEGWAFCNNDGFYLFILRNQNESSMKSYVLLQTNPAIGKGEQIEDLALLAYEMTWGKQLKKSNTNEDSDEISYSLEKNIENLCLFLTRQS